MKTLKSFFKLIKSTQRYMIILALFSVVSSGISIYWPFLLRGIINDIVDSIRIVGSGGLDIAAFSPIFLLIIFLSVINISMGTAQSYYQVKLTTMMESIIRTRVFEHLSSLSIDYFDNEKIGKTINKISRGVNRGTGFIQNLSNWTLSQFITYIVVIIIFFKLNPLIGMLCVILSIVHLTVSHRMTKMLREYHGKINKHYDEVLGHQVEVFQNIHLVRHFAMAESEEKRFKTKFHKIVSLTMERAGKRLKYGLARNTLSELLLASVMFITIYEAATGMMTPGDIFLVATFLNYVRWPLWNFSWIYDDAMESLKSIEDIMGIFEQKPMFTDTSNAKKLKVKAGQIRLKNVSFSYNGGRNVIKPLNLTIPAGKSIAIVGSSGVGKSTLIKLITRFYEPTNGEILIDGVDIKDVTQASLHQNIGVVSQQNILFNDTLKFNLNYGTTNATPARITQALKIAHLDKFVADLPKGLNTLVGERGIKLSGGEAQRVAIARAVIKDAPILILDEATSSLDSESEVLIKDSLDKLILGKTTIIIAHRLSTVMKADLIVVMDKGRIVEQGTHDDLVNHKGIYAKLFEIQSGGYIK